MLIVDRLLDGPNEGGPAKLFDLIMLVITAGLVRTREEFAMLFERGGFELVDVTRSESPMCVIEAAPV